MWDRDWVNKKLNNTGIQPRFFGRNGQHALDELEAKLQFEFDENMRTFIKEIGNLDVGCFDMIFTGIKPDRYNCITHSEEMGLLKEGNPAKGVVFCEYAGVTYVMHKGGIINCYEYDDISPERVLFSYPSLSELIDEFIEISKD